MPKKKTTIEHQSILDQIEAKHNGLRECYKQMLAEKLELTKAYNSKCTDTYEEMKKLVAPVIINHWMKTSYGTYMKPKKLDKVRGLRKPTTLSGEMLVVNYLDLISQYKRKASYDYCCSPRELIKKADAISVSKDYILNIVDKTFAYIIREVDQHTESAYWCKSPNGTFYMAAKKDHGAYGYYCIEFSLKDGKLEALDLMKDFSDYSFRSVFNPPTLISMGKFNTTVNMVKGLLMTAIEESFS